MGIVPDSEPHVQTMDLSTAWNREEIDADAAGMIVLHVRVSRANIDDIESAVYVLASQVVKVETRYSESGKPLGATVETSGGQRIYATESARAVVSLLARMREASRE